MIRRKPASLKANPLVGSLAAAVDRAVTLAVKRQHRRGTTSPDAEQLLQRARLAASYYEAADLDDFFPSPAAIVPVETPEARGKHRTLSWPSTHRLACADLQRPYTAHRRNARACARLYAKGAQRPVAILVHGYMGGAFALEQRIWPLRWLDELGLDTVLFTLPFHGLRASGGAPVFPQSDIRFSVEGFRQSVTDLRDLVHWLRERGHPHVGLMGMSLGGYVIALTATLEPELAFLVPIVPLACLVEFAREQGRFPQSRGQAIEYEELLERAYRAVSPLSRPSRLAGERVLVVAGKADRITPPHHARALAHHFSAPLEAWPGGHLLQFGRSKSLQRVGRFLRETTRR